MRKALVSDAILGKFAAREVPGPHPSRPLLRKGARINEDVLSAIERYGLNVIWISDELLPDVETKEGVRIETREAARNAFRGAYEAAERWQEDKTPPKSDDGSRIMSSVRMLVADVTSNRDVLSNLSFIRAWDDYTFEHSVQVATASLLLGKQIGLDEDALHRLGIGAMLHDVGKALIPQEILRKPGRLTDEEFAVMRMHPQLGWEFLREGFPTIMPTSSVVALQHHERLDGSGYPFGRREHEIYLFSQIVAAADVFDALRAQRAYRSDLSPAEVAATMRREAGAHLRQDLVEILLSHVALAPVGSVVQLSDGRYGMVTSVRPQAPLHPVVRVVSHDGERRLRDDEVDLAEDHLEITQLLDGWPDEVLSQAR